MIGAIEVAGHAVFVVGEVFAARRGFEITEVLTVVAGVFAKQPVARNCHYGAGLHRLVAGEGRGVLSRFRREAEEAAGKFITGR